ncbi:hypothetical protein AALP_AA2G026100 [Arabis alpina]|uniref:ATP-dependent DNA ligase family profile domain-containing protein n=1 Tax=Arabis alpina TaxID=50452 RepID=A0A087HEW7_ARAAL|nr:hypothetical protein AALP_AA2G026100 [Arabis alpina]
MEGSKVVDQTLLEKHEQWISIVRLMEKDPSTIYGQTVEDILCNMLRTVIATTPEDLLATVYLASNQIAPVHEDAELRIDVASMIKAVSEFSGLDVEDVQERFDELRCFGDLAKQCAQPTEFNSEPLTIVKVFNTLREMAKDPAEGDGVMMKDQLNSLLLATRDCEAMYLTCLLLPLYIMKSTQSNPHIPPRILSQRLGSLYGKYSLCFLSLRYPVKSGGEILDIFKDTPFTCEYKYDGLLAQIHYMDDGAYEIFSSRGPKTYTSQFTDVLSRLKKPSLKSCILDCVVVPFDRAGMKIIPLEQVTLPLDRAGMKIIRSEQILRTESPQNVNVSDTEVDVCIFAYDMLYLNGQLLIQDSLNIRRQKLYDSFEEDPGVFKFATTLTSTNADEIQKFFQDSVDYGCKGITIKTLNSDATFERSEKKEWLELRKEPLAWRKVYAVDSVDLVPIAAFHYSDNPTGSYRAFVLACYDFEKKEFQSICIATAGFSEAVLEERSSSLRSKVISFPKQNYQVDDRLMPDVWFQPTEVWEVKAISMRISPVQRAAIGIVDPDKGISLDIPRLVRVRADKKPEEATSSVQVVEMFNRIKRKQLS